MNKSIIHTIECCIELVQSAKKWGSDPEQILKDFLKLQKEENDD